MFGRPAVLSTSVRPQDNNAKTGRSGRSLDILQNQMQPVGAHGEEPVNTRKVRILVAVHRFLSVAGIGDQPDPDGQRRLPVMENVEQRRPGIALGRNAVRSGAMNIGNILASDICHTYV